MFIHFDSGKSAECDDCGNTHAIMHLMTERSERSLTLCINCLTALTQALGRASKKLKT